MSNSESRNYEGKCCYLAGPMRGYPQYNFPAFYAAAAELRRQGIAVWSPAENDVHADGFNPTTDAAQPMRHYMKRDLPAVLNADFVAVLPGWEKSQGAQLEVHVARTCGIPVLNAGDLSPATPSETAKQISAGDGMSAGRFHCACVFSRPTDFSEAVLVSECAYHSKPGKEAARYRWLRNDSKDPKLEERKATIVEVYQGEGMDEQIDKAMGVPTAGERGQSK